ncbi:MAG: hypothetical protein KDB16_12265 [Acidimicrobiales bacterium]|nr:hypothetical protein [Acidimicrobiales bacterium]
MTGAFSRDGSSTARLVRTLIVAATLLIPVVVIAFALRSNGEPADTATIEATSTTTSQPPTTTSQAQTTTSQAETTTSTQATTTTTTDSTTTSTEAGSSGVDGVGTLVARRTTFLAAQPGDAGGAQLDEGTSLSMTGRVNRTGGDTWFEAISPDGTGWVTSADFAISTTGFDRRTCAELPAEPTQTPLAYRPGTADGSADGVVALETHTSAECTRTVLLLAPKDGPSLSAAFPDDLAVVDFGGFLRIDLDDAEHAGELNYLELPGGGVVLTSYASNDVRLIIDRGPSAVTVSFLAEPARIVIDSKNTTGIGPGIGGGVVISSQSILDAKSGADGEVVVISGWARLANGLGEIAFRNAPAEGDEPGTALAREVVFSGTASYGTVERSWYFYRTELAGGEVWSPFRFQISSLTSGTYELFMGLGGEGNIPADIESPGIYQILVVD